MRRFLSVVLVVAILAGGAGWWWLHRPLPVGNAVLDLTIPPGTSARGVAEAVSDAGVKTPPALLFLWFRLSGEARQIKAGSYEIEPGATPISLLGKLVRGEQALRSVTFVEGWNFRQVREALSKAERLAPDSKGLAPDMLMKSLGRPGVDPEGRFFPDTYTYAKGSSDLDVLKRAMLAMDRRLDAAWAQRQPGIPLKTPEEALTLASIIEKETGQGADRPLISGVFNNRLRIGMPLQTDPTVIYGLGATFDGNLRRRDLQTDTPYNTYTRNGLPPTPISMPGAASLLAAVQPAQTTALYFVARGDGSSHFSPTLQEHNRAVNQFQRR
ncbi:aminodeoxychorismate lyase [Rhodoferax koreense]|uniref:Endolytic murein transglycosylase n=1 Tax=Rhodoferax koreensis TaxID=1842727 RepID=A0A1P8JWN1_9BURK|nr:endolytic transglycosylase MltG [Rhodoferax koreense]APW38170.1 aminodeoxychorismate lyase [Rhodoferax koreense]